MYKNGKNHPQVACSFCGKPAEQVTKLITGAGVHICNECVTMCHNILEEEFAREKKNFYRTKFKTITNTFRD